MQRDILYPWIQGTGRVSLMVFTACNVKCLFSECSYVQEKLISWFFKISHPPSSANEFRAFCSVVTELLSFLLSCRCSIRWPMQQGQVRSHLLPLILYLWANLTSHEHVFQVKCVCAHVLWWTDNLSVVFVLLSARCMLGSTHWSVKVKQVEREKNIICDNRSDLKQLRELSFCRSWRPLWTKPVWAPLHPVRRMSSWLVHFCFWSESKNFFILNTSVHFKCCSYTLVACNPEANIFGCFQFSVLSLWKCINFNIYIETVHLLADGLVFNQLKVKLCTFNDLENTINTHLNCWNDF